MDSDLFEEAFGAWQFVSVLMAFAPKPVPGGITDSTLLPYAIDASNVLASLAPRALKEPVRQTVAEIRQAWNDQIHKSRIREILADKDANEAEVAATPGP